jgi:hypothetical protein
MLLGEVCQVLKLLVVVRVNRGIRLLGVAAQIKSSVLLPADVVHCAQRL